MFYCECLRYKAEILESSHVFEIGLIRVGYLNKILNHTWRKTLLGKRNLSLFKRTRSYSKWNDIATGTQINVEDGGCITCNPSFFFFEKKPSLDSIEFHIFYENNLFPNCPPPTRGLCRTGWGTKLARQLQTPRLTSVAPMAIPAFMIGLSSILKTRTLTL